jgi:type VII secretion integral membrane protein EccD
VSAAPETADAPVISAAPDLVRLSLLDGRTQVDVSLPLDVPVAGLIPQLTQLIRSGNADGPDGSEDPFTKEAKHTVWVLGRDDAKDALAPTQTLRQAGVPDGELLRLTAVRTLSAPTHYDDVVDAAARLNKAGYPAWNAGAARWMTFAGIYLASGVWTYFLLTDTFAGRHAILLGLSVLVAVALVGVATSAHRSHRQNDVGAGLGWAALPIGAAVAWVALGRLGDYQGSAAGAAMVLVAVVTYRVVGTGHYGYLAAGVLGGLGAIAFGVHAAGVRADIVGAGTAVLATLSCLLVPRLTARMARFEPPADGEPVVTAESPAGEGVWARVQSATLTRAALYSGLAATAGVGAATILTAPHRIALSGLAFCVVCAATLGLFTQRPGSAMERTALVVPAVALLVFSCARAQDGSGPVGLLGFGALLLATFGFAVIGITARPGRPPARVRSLLASLTYLSAAALIPMALWVIGVYPRLGLR